MTRLFTLLTLVLFVGCTSSDTSKEAVQDQSEKTETEKKGAKVASDVTLNLNDGERWKVNPKMREVVQTMIQELSEVSSAGQADYVTLAKSLEHQMSKLSKYSTMSPEGESELKKWQIANNQRIEAMRKSKDADEAARIMKELQESLKKFEEYFD